MRLNRAIAERGYCSRRKADELIFAGDVLLNGEKILNPAQKVQASDEISIKGKLLQSPKKAVYLMLYKPVQVISSVHDPQGRTTVLDILPEKYKQLRLFPVGRLDYFSEGLLLLTNDGSLANILMHPRYAHEKKYEVLIRGKLEENKLDELKKGLILEEKIKLLPVNLEVKRLKDGNSLLTMTLKQGLNRQIRRICEQFNWIILKLKRISEANLNLGDLQEGECRELTQTELASLKNKHC